MNIRKLRLYIKNPYRVFHYLGVRGMLNFIPDEWYLKLAFRGATGRKLNLQEPKTYNEKLQWLKLHDRRSEYCTMVDKYEAKQYVAKQVGSEYVIPIYGVWDRFEDIDFDKLPEKFVLKCTHDSGSVVICRDRNSFDIHRARRILTRGVKKSYYHFGREWVYKNVKPRIIAEQYMFDAKDDALTDYKWFCFNGEPKIMYISKDCGKEPRTDFFDMNYCHLPIRVRDPQADNTPEKPQEFEKMKVIAQRLSHGIPHVRVDFYVVENRIYVGEMTFFHNSGFIPITPSEWDKQMGDWIVLPKS